jgi:DNA polymerase
MTDDRKDAADIVRSVRRYIERERAGGGADLLADGASRAQRAGVRALGEPERRRGGSKPAGSREPASAGLDSTRAGGRPAPGGRVAAAPPPKPAAAVLDVPAPQRFTEGLNPFGLETRAFLAAAALPILSGIGDEARACRKCALCETRTNAVPGVGTARSGIVFVGEAPGASEDQAGEPFVGRAGQLLDKIIKAMDDAQLIPGMPLDREHVYICNVLKCRPPENRNPLPQEIESCSPYLRRQLAAIQPRIICCLGKFAAELLVGVKGTIRDLRGKVYRYEGAKLLVTYHPAFLLRNADFKRPVWEDMQLLAREYQSD